MVKKRNGIRKLCAYFKRTRMKLYINFIFLTFLFLQGITWLVIVVSGNNSPYFVYPVVKATKIAVKFKIK